MGLVISEEQAPPAEVKNLYDTARWVARANKALKEAKAEYESTKKEFNESVAAYGAAQEAMNKLIAGE